MLLLKAKALPVGHISPRKGGGHEVKIQTTPSKWAPVKKGRDGRWARSDGKPMPAKIYPPKEAVAKPAAKPAKASAPKPKKPVAKPSAAKPPKATAQPKKPAEKPARPAQLTPGPPRPVDPSLIIVSPQIRKNIKEEDIRNLANTIESQGLQKNLVARPHPTMPGKLELISGHRRLMAMRLLASEGRVPKHNLSNNGLQPYVAVVNATDDEKNAMQAAENLQAVANTPLEEAAFFQMQVNDGKSPEDIAEGIGKPVRHVLNHLALNRASGFVQKYLDRGVIPKTAAWEVADLPEMDQNRLIEKYVTEKWSLPTLVGHVNSVKAQIRMFQEGETMTAVQAAADAELKAGNIHRAEQQEKFRAFLQRQIDFVNRFFDEDGVRLSALAGAASGTLDISLARLNVIHDRLGEAINLMKKKYESLAQPSMFGLPEQESGMFALGKSKQPQFQEMLAYQERVSQIEEHYGRLDRIFRILKKLYE